MAANDLYIHHVKQRPCRNMLLRQFRSFPCLMLLLLLLLADCVLRSNAASTLDKEMYSNLTPMIFAPGGRLFSVEKALESVNADHPANNLVIAIRCQEGTVVVTSEVHSAYILTTNATESSVDEGESSPSSFPSLLLPDTGVARPPFARLATNLWGVTGGIAVDAQLLRLQLHNVAENMRFAQDAEDDSLARPSTVARRLADRRQRATQQRSDDDDDVGLLNATALVFHQDDLWRVDPTGQFYQCQAALVGRRAHVAEADLIRQLSERIHNGEQEPDKLENNASKLQECVSALSSDDALRLAADCVRNALMTKAPTTSPPTKALSMRALILHNGAFKWMNNDEIQDVMEN